MANLYLDSLRALYDEDFHRHLSVKIPALWNSRERVAEVVGRTRELGAPADFDSHATGFLRSSIASPGDVEKWESPPMTPSWSGKRFDA